MGSRYLGDRQQKRCVMVPGLGSERVLAFNNDRSANQISQRFPQGRVPSFGIFWKNLDAIDTRIRIDKLVS